MQAPLLTGAVGTAAICIPLWQRGRVCPLSHTGFCMDIFRGVLIALFFRFLGFYLWGKMRFLLVYFVLSSVDTK